MDRLVNVLNDDAGLNLGHVADRGFLNDLGRKYHQQSPVLAKRGSQNRGQKRNCEFRPCLPGGVQQDAQRLSERVPA